MRSRSVGAVVLADEVDIPAPPSRLMADWAREAASHLCLAPGDVEPLPLARARMRWPALRDGVAAARDWTRALGLHDLLAASELALMACRGARYHHDAAHYGGAVFCNLFLTPDKGLDAHFPAAGRRIPLRQGTILMFDTAQAHAVVRRNSTRFEESDFAEAADGLQVFLSWELSIENADLCRAMGVVLDVDPVTASRLQTPQRLVNGVVASVCPASGRWLPDAPP